MKRNQAEGTKMGYNAEQSRKQHTGRFGRLSYLGRHGDLYTQEDYSQKLVRRGLVVEAVYAEADISAAMKAANTPEA